MKVLQINKAFYPEIGGIEKVALDICEQISNEIEMEVLVANNKYKNKIEYIKDVKVTKLGSLGKLFSMPIAPLFPLYLGKYTDVDVLHFHFPFPLGEASYLFNILLNKRMRNKPTIVTWHSDIIKQKNILKVYKPFLNKFLKQVDYIVATSPNMIENSPFLNDNKNKCKVIPLGIDPSKFTLNEYIEDKVKIIKKEYTRTKVFFMGRLVYYKGVSYLIDAVKSLDVDLIIGGTGPLIDDLKKQVDELKIQEKVHFIGYIKDEDLPAYYYASDIFVLPSVESSEAFGIVQLEAQVCGTPVISTNLPTGVPYANLNDVTGLVVEPKNSEELRKAIKTLIEDEKLRTRLGNQAKQRVLQEFTTEKMGERYLNLYKEINQIYERKGIR